MAAVIAARFDTFAAADSAAHALFALGVDAADVDVFFASTPPAATTCDALDANKLSVRYREQAHVSVLATLGAVFGTAVVMSFSGPALAMLAGGASGAFLGAWVGAMWLAARSRVTQVEQEGWVALLTARVRVAQAQEVSLLLADAGGRHIEQSRGTWEHGRWVEGKHGALVDSSLRARQGHASAVRASPSSASHRAPSARTPFAG